MTSMTNESVGNNSDTRQPSSREPGAAAQGKMAKVADEAPAQLSNVAHDVKAQLRESSQRTLGDVRSQADQQTTRAAQGLRDLSTRAQALAEGRTEDAGNLGEMAETLGRQTSEFAQRLENGGVQGLLDDTARFGRKRPMMFLALALGAGFVAGRLIRTGAEVASHDANDASNNPNAGTMPSPLGGAPVVEGQYTGVRA